LFGSKDDSIVIRGKVTGSLNGVSLEDQEIHAYVHTLATDARNYVALGRIPATIGSRASLLLPFASPIHWLFAGDINNNALNGFTLTGGVFNRQSDSTYFNEQGEVIGNLYVQQNFTGLFEDGKELRMEAVIEGNLPDLVADEQVIYLDYSQDYEYKSIVEDPDTKKEIETKGSIPYKVSTVRSPDNFRSFRIEHSERIHFSVCNAANEERLGSSSALTKLSTKRLFVTYTQSEAQVRFSSANYIRSLENQTESSHACDLNRCHVYAECVSDQESESGYYCQCKPGFDGDGFECADINECEEGTTYCSPNAQCYNLLGHYECKCTPPRIGDGRICEWEESSDAYGVCSRCDVNARCITDDTGSTSYCKCNSGYSGDGYECQLGNYER
jgi:nidogen (entactin)